MIHITNTEWYEQSIEKIARKFIEYRKNNKDIFLHWGRGCGKTYTMLRILEKINELEKPMK